MLDFQLFRVKVYPPQQKELFYANESRSEILKKTISSSPSCELRKGIEWHIGNVALIDNSGLYFRVGRISSSTLELFQDGNFSEQQFETAPYTHVLLDIKLEVCAIAKKPKVSPSATGIANQLIRLLNRSEAAQQHKYIFEIGAINDPADFIEHIQKAYAISRFWITFSRPNAYDINEDFIKPAQKLLSEANGEKGKSEIKGETLKPDALEALARSAAATGDEAGAAIQTEPSRRKINKHLKGNPVIIPQEDLSDNEQKKGLLEKIREIYQKIRGRIRKADG